MNTIAEKATQLAKILLKEAQEGEVELAGLLHDLNINATLEDDYLLVHLPTKDASMEVYLTPAGTWTGEFVYFEQDAAHPTNMPAFAFTCPPETSLAYVAKAVKDAYDSATETSGD